MQITASFAELEKWCHREPPVAVFVLGSGLGSVKECLREILAVPFAAVPGLPAAAVAGHAGRLVLGDWAERRVLVCAGRLHRYEGHPWEVVVRPVQIAAGLGARIAVLTNAAGGIADHLGPGRLLALRDHIDWARPYCWREPGPGALGPPHPSPYAPRLLDLLGRSARALGLDLPQGVYAQVPGPCYETPAEIRALRAWGADAVGMSTGREAQAAADAGLECAALSCVTNRAAGLSDGPLTHEEVLAASRAAAGRLADLLEQLLALLPA